MVRPALPALLLALAACQDRAAPPGDAGPGPLLDDLASEGERTERGAPESARGPSIDAYRGVIEPDLLVTMRLRLDGDATRGSYFYDNKGTEIALQGALTGDGELTLTETSLGKQSGTFAGRRGPAGSISGTWTDARTGATRAFRLDPIERRAGSPVLVRKRWLHTRRTPKRPPPATARIKLCNVDLAYPEIYGAADPGVEAAINDKLRRALIREGDDACDAPFARSGSYAVHTNRAGVLSVSFTYDQACVECSHPTFGGTTVNVRVDTGADVPLDALLARGGKEGLTERLRQPVEARIKATDGAVPGDRGPLLTAYLAGNYVLEDKGLRLIAFFHLQHTIQALDGDFGVVLPWTTLGPLLDPESPAAAVWTSTRPP